MYVSRGAHTAALGAFGATGLPGFRGTGFWQLESPARNTTRRTVAANLMESGMLPHRCSLGDKSTYVCAVIPPGVVHPVQIRMAVAISVRHAIPRMLQARPERSET